ncbi:response regulator transcription factor [Evansella cellulosilytica]|uniref:Two component transcriptional regulator, winged helix family n=1 Tax=Evansella cellulosilytica (strain ATCC 21833 / DSM 2522 / FERM P-1141 / JCM 9156 / N-4) TaxID=649639 RepID=E6TQX0_EVAC2|nr:response regulator transcription factor [Evansella cellulosilytica]ADU31745.1 two component transcriptional regulator, winged helix family [Evansella cellulosilytica DSM 2522]
MNQPINVLVIEDDPNICDLLKLYLEKEGYAVTIAHDGEKGLIDYYDHQPDFIVLDIMLPKIDGWEVCREIRKDRNVPVIMITGKGESYDKIKGLELGADDYVVKPFDPKEVLARMKAVMRRTNPYFGTNEEIALFGLKINIREYTLLREEKEIVLPPKELELLFFLISHKNNVFTRQQLLDEVWGYDYEGDPRTIDVHIKRIREKIGEGSGEWSLKTIRGVGYKFEVNELV